MTDLKKTLDAAGITFIERGWLSANNILIQGEGHTALVDSGYCIHASQTVELVKHALNSSSLNLLLNTHLHSDHCGGNAALQSTFPDLRVLIPPGDAPAVQLWDTVALSFEATGQNCPRFTHQGLLVPGQTLRLGKLDWEIHAAKGHDPHSIVLFQPQNSILISADALWENGFGVVFPELEGISAFEEVRQTLAIIEGLSPRIVIPGHGAIFCDVNTALERARSRLQQFIKNPDKHQRHALKVLIKYKLLEWQSVSLSELLKWSLETPYIRRAMPEKGKKAEAAAIWINELLQELHRSGAIQLESNKVLNC